MAVRKPLPEGSRRPSSLGADVAYTAEQIQVLEGREHVRRRLSMYIGSTRNTDLHQLVYVVVENTVHEDVPGYAARSVVPLFDRRSVGVHDDSRATPDDVQYNEGRL